MAAKAFLVACAQVLLVQCALSQCIGRGPAGPYGYDGLAYGAGAPFGLAYDGLAYGAGCGGVASTGGGFPVTSVSPIAPTGLSIVSENAYEGALAVGGELPFLSAVAIEGILPTAGVGAISYGCGNGAVGITSEAPIATGIVGPAPAYGPGLPYGPGLAAAGPLYGTGYNGLGVGCGYAL